LLAIRDAHRQYGHVQEVIVQNFTPHPGTRMSGHSEPSAEDMAHAVALARLILPLDVSVQAPPNLNAARTLLLIESGINDFGGISPLTPDYINPEKPWPNLVRLAESVAAFGFELRPRLPIYESFLAKPGFLDESLVSAVHGVRQRLCSEVPPFGTRHPSAVASADLDA
jgi:FO synthase